MNGRSVCEWSAGDSSVSSLPHILTLCQPQILKHFWQCFKSVPHFMRQNYSWQSDSLEPLVLLWHCQEPGKRLLSRARRKCSLSWHDTISMQPKQHEKHVGHLDGMLATSSLAGNRLRVATLVCRQAKMPLQTSILQQMWVLSSANVCFVFLRFRRVASWCCSYWYS